MAGIICPGNEYKAQSAIVLFIRIVIRKGYELRQQCHLIFISRCVATKKQSKQHVLLIFRSQYRYLVTSKIFQPSKVPVKIYILSYVHISFKISMSLIQKTRAPPRNRNAPPGGAAQFGNLCVTTFPLQMLTLISL
jgi:hypothetical protein